MRSDIRAVPQNNSFIVEGTRPYMQNAFSKPNKTRSNWKGRTN